MRFASVSGLGLLAACLGLAPRAVAQELPRVSAQRPLRVGGVVAEVGDQDLIGLSRVKFQGLIAAELAGVGYRLANDDGSKRLAAEPAPLTLIGYVKEEMCDDEAPSQCRVAIQWELQDARGVVVYRAITRAVEQTANLEKLRRSLIEGALRSLLQRRRFALQLGAGLEPAQPVASGPLGFKQCKRAAMELPQAARAAAASLVFVESGSNLAAGAIVSGDGLILTVASSLEANAPLRVRFSAEQTLPARVVAMDRQADVALLHVAAHTDATCLAIGDTALLAGQAVFGISSEASEDRAISLAGGALQAGEAADGQAWLRVDPLLARVPGGALLDSHGRLVGVAPKALAKPAHASVPCLAVSAALAALGLKPAAITDPRLLDEQAEKTPLVGYVRDRDDPPFALTKRYTYGTSTTAHRVRTASWVTVGVGGVGVAATWLTFRASRDLSTSAHDRYVVLNDVSWVLLGLGAVGVGVSYALPQGHDIVAVQSAQSTPSRPSAGERQLFVELKPSDSKGGVELELGGRI